MGSGAAAENMGRSSVNVLIENLDHVALGFDRAIARAMGRAGYQPATLLKIFIYGHLNRVQSRSRCSSRQELAYGVFLAVIAAPTCC